MSATLAPPMLPDILREILEVIDSWDTKVRMRTMLRCSLVSRLFYLITKPFLYRELKMRLGPRVMDAEHDWHSPPTWRFNPSPFWTPRLARPPHLHSKDEHLAMLVQSDTLKSVRGLSIPMSLVATPTNTSSGTFRISQNQIWFNQLLLESE
jgi:hypothetical protein